MGLDFLNRISYPIVQGGMGVRVSSYNLARSVALNGGMGLVSSVGLDTVLIRELQQGDPTGEIEEVLKEFPDQKFVDQVFDKYYVEGGIEPNKKYKLRKIIKEFNQDEDELSLDEEVDKLIVAATYAEVKRAKMGHDKPIGINFMYKIRWPILQGLYGAMLAGADAVFVGAGFPRKLASVLEDLSEGKKARLPADVQNASKDWYHAFNPEYGPVGLAEYVAIVSNHLGVKAVPDAKKYVIESPYAGGHNPPARSKEIVNGEPVYTDKDLNNIKLLNSMLKKNEEQNGFRQEWIMAGGCYDKLDEALELGAKGIQLGSVMAITKESGIISRLKEKMFNYLMAGGVVKTDAVISPTGFPFKVLMMPGTLAEQSVYDARSRICDLNYLINYFEVEGKIGVRCPSEPIKAYVKKGGKLEDTEGKGCLCNNLTANAGLGSPNEPFVVTFHDVKAARELFFKYGMNVKVKDVINEVLEKSKLFIS